MRIKIAIAFLLVAFFFLQSSSLCLAHFLSTDKNIGAVLHVDPNDDPVAKQQAGFFFEFKDKENKFLSSECDCTFLIFENGTQIYSQPLFQNSQVPSLQNASVFFTFPKRDVYEVKVVGKPFTKNSFQTFSLTWNFRVDQEVHNSTKQNNFFVIHLPHIFAIVIFLLFFIAYFAQKFLPKRKPKVKGGETDDKKDSIVY